MNPTPPGYPESAASGPPPGHQAGSQQQAGPAPGRYQQPGDPRYGVPGQESPPPGGGPVGGSPSRPRPGLPPLPVIVLMVVCVLALLNAIAGFLRSAELTRTTAATVPLGSMYAVAGWIPALLVVSGLAAAATRLKGVSAATLWAVSASTAVMGGVGALFYLVSREGADAGLGFALVNNGVTGSTVSVGLALTVLFGLLQLIAAVGGLLLTQSPQLDRRAQRAAGGTSDTAHRYGPGSGGFGSPYGPPPGQSPAQGYGQTPYGPPQGGYGPPQSGGFGPGPGYGPPQHGPDASAGYGPSQNPPFPNPPHQNPPPQGPPPQGPPPQQGYGAPQAGYGRPAPGAPTAQPGYVPAYPAAGGIAPYGQYSQTAQFGLPAGDHRQGPTDRGPAADGPPFFDPQSGRQVHTGLTDGPAAGAPVPLPVAEPTPAQPGEAERALRPDPTPPVEYQRTEYGSSDFEWEPTYSEAPTYEARASEEEADTSQRENVVRYEDPGQRPTFAPPQLDSARHEGWDAGFAEDTLTGTGQPPAEQQDRYRSIPRAE